MINFSAFIILTLSFIFGIWGYIIPEKETEYMAYLGSDNSNNRKSFIQLIAILFLILGLMILFKN